MNDNITRETNSNHKLCEANREIFLPGNDYAYQKWREYILQNAPGESTKIFPVHSLENPSASEVNAIIAQCKKSNTAIYQTGDGDSNRVLLRRHLREFCVRFGLTTTEAHRSGDEDGIVALEVDAKGPGAGYIPYTDKKLNWHTDGYYNAPEHRIQGMVLHCVRDASEGGVNEFLDPQIAYIRLRDANPAYIEALMHSRAMTIPENDDKHSGFRPISTGPVFFLDDKTGALQMRYSARGRNIIWRDNAELTAARDMLRDIMADDPMIIRHKLKPGEGVITNNVLHNRSRFVDGENGRLMYRIRFMERVGQSGPITV